MHDFNVRRKKAKLAYFFAAAKLLLPLWQPSPIAVKAVA